MSFGLQLVSPPEIRALTLDACKAQLRIEDDDTASDYEVAMFIEAVTNQAEKITRRALTTSTWRYSTGGFPAHGSFLEVPRAPLQSVTHIKYYDTGGTLQTLSSSDYFVDADIEPGRIGLKVGSVWPSTANYSNAVQVTFVAGWARREDIPFGLRQAMLYHVAHLYEFRQPVESGRFGQDPIEIPFTLKSMYAPFRVSRFF